MPKLCVTVAHGHSIDSFFLYLSFASCNFMFFSHKCEDFFEFYLVKFGLFSDFEFLGDRKDCPFECWSLLKRFIKSAFNF